jgi:large subunit ribosomal protein L15
MDLTNLSHGVHKRKPKKRVGRGIGSGHGKTASRGHKGQYSSAGANLPGALFTGGQTPIHRRFPKRGFSNATWAKVYAEVNVDDLDKFDAGAAVDLAALKGKGIINGTWDGLRVLGNGELKTKLTVRADHFTAGARRKIEAAGGTCDLIAPPKKPVKNKMGQGKRSQRRKAAEAAEKAKAEQNEK